MSNQGYYLPPNMKATLDRYVERRLAPGRFTQLLLKNKVHEALPFADKAHQQALYDTLRYITMELPAGCYGSPEKVEAWLRGDDA